MTTNQMQFLQDCAAAMNAYRQLTLDPRYGSRVKQGRMQLVRVHYNVKGVATVEECSDWIPVDQWLAFMESISL